MKCCRPDRWAGTGVRLDSGCAKATTWPVRTKLAARRTCAGPIKFKAPASSSGPQRPQAWGSVSLRSCMGAFLSLGCQGNKVCSIIFCNLPVVVSGKRSVVVKW